jgi:putative ABC transport system permease protein
MRALAYWRRHLPLAVAVVVTVAFGIGAATAVYALVDAVIVRALPVRDPERLVWMWNARAERDRAPFSALDLGDYRDQNSVLEGLAPFINWTANLTGTGDAERLEGIRVDPGFFDLLGVRPALGRTIAPGDGHARVTVLTERLWRRRFAADPRIVGQQVSLNGAAYTVIGVLPFGFAFPFRDAEIAVPLALESDPRRADRGAGFLRVVARLKPGVSLAAARSNLDIIGARLRHDYPDTNAKKLGVNLFPLDREMAGDARPLLLTLLGAVGLLLFVACANIASLLFGSLSARRREFGIRTALGATRRRMAAQLFGEIALLVLLGGAAGTALGRGLARLLVWWGGSTLPRLDDIGLTPRVVLFALASTACAAIVCGVLPAWLFSAAPAAALGDETRTNSGGAVQSRLRRGFVAVQLASALMLLVAMLLTVRSFERLQAVNPGFDGRAVLAVQLALPPVKYARTADIILFADRFRADVAAVPGVRDVSAISLLPLAGLLSTQDYRIVGQPAPSPNDVPQAHYRIAMPGYFRVMGIGLKGREFDETDRDETRRVTVISRTLAMRHWPDRTPIGQHIVVGRDTLEVVGVCDDVKQFSLAADPTADLYVPLRQMPASQAQFLAARMYWLVRTAGDPMVVADLIRARVRRLDNEIATSSSRPMTGVIAESIGSRRFNADLMAIASLSSLLLALIGVYSVTAFSTRRRTREIGIRVALGAQGGEVVRSVLAAEGMAIGLGLAIGAAGAVGIARMLASVLFASEGVDLAMIAAAVATLGGAASVATYLPARRAARIDPLSALRE